MSPTSIDSPREAELPKRPSSAVGWLVFLTIVLGGAAAGGLLWFIKLRDRNLPVTMQEYFELKQKGLIREAWMKGGRDELIADLRVGYMKGGKSYKHVSVRVPSLYIDDPDLFNKLLEGLPPASFHYER